MNVCIAPVAYLSHALLVLAAIAAVLCTWMLWDLSSTRRFAWDDSAPRKVKVRTFTIMLGAVAAYGFLFVSLLEDFIARVC